MKNFFIPGETFTLPATKEIFKGENVTDYFNEIKKNAENQGKDFVLYNKIPRLLEHVTSTGYTEVTGKLYGLVKAHSHREVCDQATKDKIYITYDLHPACALLKNIFYKSSLTKQTENTFIWVYVMINKVLCMLSISYQAHNNCVCVSLTEFNPIGGLSRNCAAVFNDVSL